MSGPKESTDWQTTITFEQHRRMSEHEIATFNEVSEKYNARNQNKHDTDFAFARLVQDNSTTQDDEWRLFAECAISEIPVGSFFIDSAEIISKVAAMCCSICSVKKECLEDAIANNMSGYWGGTSERGRRRIKQARARALAKATKEAVVYREISEIIHDYDKSYLNTELK